MNKLYTMCTKERQQSNGAQVRKVAARALQGIPMVRERERETRLSCISSLRPLRGTKRVRGMGGATGNIVMDQEDEELKKQ
eukprot:1179282-Prorocentrum_minimum.AAC.5